MHMRRLGLGWGGVGFGGEVPFESYLQCERWQAKVLETSYSLNI